LHGLLRVWRGYLAELVRLIVVILFASVGWQVASVVGSGSTNLLVGVVLGSGIGYVLGGVFGRLTAQAVSELEREFQRVSAAEVLSGCIGFVLGLVIAGLLSLPLFHLPPGAGYPAIAFVYLTLSYAGYRVGRSMSDELFGLFGVKGRAAGTRSGDVVVLDSSAILDGRLGPLIRMGFVRGTLLVTRGVLEELQAVADSGNPERRARGRRALDLVIALKRDPNVDLALVEEESARSDEPIDSQLVRVARSRGGALMTNDSGLARVATALEVPVRSIHALAEALRPEVIAGQHLLVRLIRRGREAGQAVGYLDDGTMVVAEEADHVLGETADLIATKTLQTSSGRMVFARLANAADA
jgi:uncharacterized protein YacL